ncbi:MAG: GNAT family N-acetyltransferase [Pirellulaceae bacterium]|nr:GNAT family N-acetyltransferase [Pirellulaceae bacterium]
MTFTFECSDQAARRDLDEIDTGIEQHNLAVPEIRNVRPIAIIGRADDGQLKGGAVGRSWGLCCELQQLWVTAEARSQGLGTELMSRFEREAKQRGCELIYLETFTFQAPGFYQHRGYRVALEIQGFANGITKYTLQKEI